MAGSDAINVSNTKNYYPPVIISLPLVLISVLGLLAYGGYWLYHEIEAGNRLVMMATGFGLGGGAVGCIFGLVVGFALVSGFSLFNQHLENKQSDKQWEMNTKENIQLMKAITDTQAKQNRELTKMIDQPSDPMSIDDKLFS
jgi:hypothetical protein